MASCGPVTIRATTPLSGSRRVDRATDGLECPRPRLPLLARPRAREARGRVIGFPQNPVICGSFQRSNRYIPNGRISVKPLHLGADSFGQTATRTSSTDQVVQPYKYVQAGGLLILWVEEDRKRGRLDVPLRGWVVRATPHQSVSLRFFRKYGYGEQPSSKNSPDSLRSPGALTAPPSSAYAPALRVTHLARCGSEDD